MWAEKRQMGYQGWVELVWVEDGDHFRQKIGRKSAEIGGIRTCGRKNGGWGTISKKLAENRWNSTQNRRSVLPGRPKVQKISELADFDRLDRIWLADYPQRNKLARCENADNFSPDFLCLIDGQACSRLQQRHRVFFLCVPLSTAFRVNDILVE